MASEVPTHELNALVTCGLFTVKRIFTLIAQRMQLTIKVPNNLYMNFPLIVCCRRSFKSSWGHFDPKKAYLELPDQPANKTPYIPKLDSAKV
jgi:hypothetical protein